ncbi:MAG: hypothetical protein M3552_09000 [Planctomycetota bacterium]|nr:hypothetical protein [Planctomycetaceae bacterium]MDQ3330776.1 hypothetical protein [Planctomycetota bacterium]
MKQLKIIVLGGSVLAGVILLVILWWQAAREEWRCSTAINFDRLLLALNNYSTHYDRGVPAIITNDRGAPLYSWRYPVLRFDYNPFPPDQYPYDLAWTDERMAVVAKSGHPSSMFRVYCCDSAGPAAQILAVTGPGAAFDAEVQMPYEQYPDNLVVLVSDCGHRGHWLKPDDVTAEELLESLDEAYTAGRETELFIGFADYHVWLLHGRIPAAKLATFLNIKTAAGANREELRPFIVWTDSRLDE